MAFDIKLTGIPRDAGAPVWTVEPAWWDARTLRCDPLFRESHVSDGYLDYVALLTPEEARELDERFAERLLDHQEPVRTKLLGHLAEGPEATLFVAAWIFEWESGLGP